MSEKDLNKIRNFLREHNIIYKIHYTILERNIDNSIKDIHLYSNSIFKLLGWSDGKIFINGVSPINALISNEIASSGDEVAHYLNHMNNIKENYYNVPTLSRYERLSLHYEE